MTKAILVIDTEKILDKYICYDDFKGKMCPLFNEEKMACQYLKNTNEDCPLKELPKPVQIPSDLPTYAHYTKGYDDGFNACLEEILGEEK